MDATIKLDKEAIFEAVRSYLQNEMPRAEIVEIESTGSYGSLQITAKVVTARPLVPVASEDPFEGCRVKDAD